MKKILAICMLAFIIASCSKPNRNIYNVANYGAANDGKTLTTVAIQKTIDECARNGGGQVYVPNGNYLVGTLNLKSNVDFHMENGAVLVATTDLSQYQIHNEQPAGIFYTERATHVSISGNGKIFGQGMEFMYKDSAKVIGKNDCKYIRQKTDFRKVKEGLGDGPVYPKDRFHQMIIFSECNDVTLSDFTCIDAPYWTFLIVHSENVEVRNLKIDNNLLIPNSDGLDVISCRNVNISDCNFSCGDDALVLAGYSTHYGDPGFKGILKPSTNINVNNCIFRSRSSAIRIGGWDQNHMSNYNLSNITIYDSNRGINLTVGDSGSIQNVNFNNIRIETRLHTGDWWGNGDPINISAIRGVPDNPIGIIKNINFNKISCRSETGIMMYASDETKLSDITFSNFQLEIVKSPLEDVAGGNQDLRPNLIPEKGIFACDIPALYIENGENIFFNQTSISWDGVEKKHYTHALEAVNIKNLRISNTVATSSPSNPGMPAVRLKNCPGFHTTETGLSIQKVN